MQSLGRNDPPYNIFDQMSSGAQFPPTSFILAKCFQLVALLPLVPRIAPPPPVQSPQMGQFALSRQHTRISFQHKDNIQKFCRILHWARSQGVQMRSRGDS